MVRRDCGKKLKLMERRKRRRDQVWGWGREEREEGWAGEERFGEHFCDGCEI
jgi:hypothetical protein